MALLRAKQAMEERVLTLEGGDGAMEERVLTLKGGDGAGAVAGLEVLLCGLVDLHNPGASKFVLDSFPWLDVSQSKLFLHLLARVPLLTISELHSIWLALVLVF